MMYEVVQKPKRATKNNSSKSKQESSMLRKKNIRIKKIFKIKKKQNRENFFQNIFES